MNREIEKLSARIVVDLTIRPSLDEEYLAGYIKSRLRHQIVDFMLNNLEGLPIDYETTIYCDDEGARVEKEVQLNLTLISDGRLKELLYKEKIVKEHELMIMYGMPEKY